MASKDQSYVLSRGFGANCRTTLQHYLYKDGLNYLLHPSIPTNNKDLKVAEIGVGTCIWLIELARELAPTTTLDGIDISFAQAPSKEFLADNISWITHDIFAEPPEELHEKYDVIHVQLFITLIRDGNPVPMLKNLMKMLKPGGYIQWGEWDFVSWEIIRTSDAPSQTNNEINDIKDFTSTMGEAKKGPGFITINWINQLNQTFESNGLTNVIVDRRKFAPEIMTLLLDTWMMASEEISFNVLDKIPSPAGASTKTRGEEMRALIRKVLQNRQNTAFNLDRVVTVGQKPLN